MIITNNAQKCANLGVDFMKMRRIVAVVLTFVILSTMAVMSTSAANTDVESSGAYANQNKYSSEVYSGDDLGFTYTSSATTWKVWSPAASAVSLKLYKTGTDRENGAGVIGTYKMTKGTKSVWSVKLDGDYKNVYYTYLVTAKDVNGQTVTNETQDIYSKALGANGNRSMVVDLKSTDPEDWANDKHVTFDNKTRSAVWEIHVQDFSSDPDSGVSDKNQGMYLAFTEGGTTYKKAGSLSTCMDYLVENGINTVQIMPLADFDGLDEIYGRSSTDFNWGYNPKNYNVPDGIYSSNPYDGNVRINEYKQMIQALHDRGISVVMDVVYNHTAGCEGSCFTKTVPGYYYRMQSGTQYYNGSGQGNELATENGMVRNFVVQSLYYWAKEYHIDGFRFDLMACIDITTLNQARSKLNTIDKGILMYGEPWAGGESACTSQPVASNAGRLDAGIGMFDEKTNDAAVYTKTSGISTGNSWIMGNASLNGGTATVFNGIKAANISGKDKAVTVNYLDNHDNYTIWDKITGAKTSSGEGKASVTTATNVNSTSATYTDQLKLAGALNFVSQGITFMNAGTEFARTKQGTKNSYNSPNKINMLDWKRAQTYKEVVDYYKGLRQINDVYSAFSSDSGANYSTISSSGTFIAFTVSNSKSGEWGKVAVGLNSGSGAASMSIPGNWTVIANNKNAGLKSLGTASGSYSVPARSAAILVETSSYKDFSDKYKFGTLTTKHYVNGALSKTTTAKYKIGTKYHALKDADLLLNNNVTKTDGTPAGTFSGDTTVSYYYEPNGKSYGKLTVKYTCSSTSQKMPPNMVYTLEKGEKYSIPVCAIEGCELNTDKYPSGSTGTFSGKDTTITFVYKPLASQKTIIHYKPTNSSWKSIQCYAYTDDGEEPLGTWNKAKRMTAEGNGSYMVEIPKASCKVMFHPASGEGQEPGQNEPGYSVAGECYIANKIVTYTSTIITSFIDIDTGAKLKTDVKTTETKKNTDQYTTKGDDSLGKLVETPANSAGFYQAGTTNVVYLYRTKEQPPTETVTETDTTKPTETVTDKPIVTDTYILGDANLDGMVSIKDATYIQQFLVNLVVFDANNNRNADVDGSGIISVKDANFIQRYLAAIATDYKIGEKFEVKK